MCKLFFPGLQSSNISEILNISNNNIGIEGLKFGQNFFSPNNSLQASIFDHNLIGPILVIAFLNIVKVKHI